MFQSLELNKPIQVRTGDYRRKWLDAKIFHVTMEQVGSDDDDNPIYGLSFSVEFIDESTIQRVTDAFGWSKDEWRYTDYEREALDAEVDQLKAANQKLIECLDWYGSYWNHDVQLEDLEITPMQKDRGNRARTLLDELKKT